MAELIFGVDFGTTNSLVSYVDPVSERLVNLLNLSDARPHPSVVWFRGGEVVVGREARKWLDAGEDAVSGSFVRSPKRLLHAPGTVFVEGHEVDPVDVIAEVLAFLRKDAVGSERQHAVPLDRAVFTIPVDLDGEGRSRLRAAARKAGISVVQFVHEPLAALYGYLRQQPDFRRLISELEGQRILVFDWGGGTLDLTLCLLEGGRLLQIENGGNNDVGGDRFDEVVSNNVLKLHASEHELEDFSGRENENARAQLLNACERAKIELSAKERAPVLVRNFLTAGPGKDLAVYLDRELVEQATEHLVSKGLAEIDRLLERSGLDHQDVAFCLPTGGMVNMPAIRNGLVQKFGPRVRRIPDGDRIISSGAAWIARDGLRLTLAKPIELLQPDQTYVPVVEAGFVLPLENETISISHRMFYCADPRDGTAHFQFARPKRLGYGSHRSERVPYLTAQLPVDPFARPFLERLESDIKIDHDYVVSIHLRSSERQKEADAKIYDLEFALDLGGERVDLSRAGHSVGGTMKPGANGEAGGACASGQVALRSNVTVSKNAWRMVPGDAVRVLQPNYFVRGVANPTDMQIEEDLYRTPCSQCGRTSFENQWHGCIHGCKGVPLPHEALKRRHELTIGN